MAATPTRSASGYSIHGMPPDDFRAQTSVADMHTALV
jgi:hypothetical protein